jgi:uncharacterized protein (TIGR03437 family)
MKPDSITAEIRWSGRWWGSDPIPPFNGFKTSGIKPMRRILLIFVCAVNLARLFGQGLTLVGSGYSNPTLIRVSPGQITTFYVTGLRVDSSQPLKAKSLPLPVTLGGVSVTINQSFPKQSLTVPLLAVQQLNACSNGGEPPPSAGPADCFVAAVTVQIPYEIQPVNPVIVGQLPPQIEFTEIVITASGTAGKAFSIVPAFDNLHVMNTCDAFPANPVMGAQVNFRCNAMVTHADGTLVTALSPAKPGEDVVIYAFGLGYTSPVVQTGAASPAAAPAVATGHFGVQFNFYPNAAPSVPYVGVGTSPWSVVDPVFAGLTPGQVGLYQINVRIPNAPTSLLPCSAFNGSTGDVITLFNLVGSNLTINIRGYSSFDGAAICVQPVQ